MASSRSRGDRRRRVLNEEARSQAGVTVAASNASTENAGDTPRYGAQANIENHPQVTDFVPRQRRTVVLLSTLLLVAATATALLVHFAPQVANKLPAVSAASISTQVAAGTIAWLSAAVLLVVAVYLRMIHMLRRHRVDDDKGRYRVWWWASAAMALLSFNSIAQLHTLATQAVASATGWSVTASAAEWWIAPTAIFGLWIGVRALLEMRESKCAFTTGLAAATCYIATCVVALGWTPELATPWIAAVAAVLPLVGHVFALATMMLFARHVVLDVQGLIETVVRKPKPALKISEQTAPEEPTEEKPLPREEPKPEVASTKSKNAAKKEKPATSQWVDGSEPEDYGDEKPRKLSKAERKRLRKQNANRRAA
ncbi:hypothetical protein [Adhaeretor mobilis]|uniref:Uncharacterized protein n=1 Tax=Adhaeretor mobilis TaxID=1930276 RepID=A0A517MXY3_9BACT|nr:hypothetical protein [Adhaeretor mobilis]QDS99723.1 hypothetical protein HG15A2_30520 [Adhaeretor mobilis]